MPRWLAAPVSMLFWASCVLLVILWTPLIALYRLATFRSDPDRYKVGKFFHRIAVVAVRLNPFWDFRVIDEVHPDPRRPYVFVANHQSNADPFLVAMVPWEMKWLSKKSIFDIPLLGWIMRVAGDVVPLAVAGTAESLPKGSIAFCKTSATVTVLPPISTRGLTVEDAPDLAKRVRAEIARAIGSETD